MMNESDLIAAGFVQQPDGSWQKPASRHMASGPVAEQVIRYDPVAAVQREEGDPTRFQVRITSYRRRLLDPDNLAGGCKYFVDCCRYAKLIPDDRPQDIILDTRQEKVRRREDERTEIIIERLT